MLSVLRVPLQQQTVSQDMVEYGKKNQMLLPANL